MNPDVICELAGKLMTKPAVPYHEHGVRAAVEEILNESGVAFNRDRFGNVLARIKNGSSARPLVLSAHLDHPGFEVTDKISADRFAARFRGGVAEVYFKAGVPVRLYPGGRPGVLKERLQEKIYVIEAAEVGQAQPSFAVWDVEDFTIRDGQIIGRACDDLVGVSAILAVLRELKACSSPVDVWGVFTRAEEVGFHGALALASEKALPADALVVSLETSRELPGCVMGRGVILRVGDRASTFHDRAGRFIAEVAGDLSKDTAFSFQRALMSGGTCEGTAYQGMGYETTAVCVALGNYHNAGENGEIRAEFVDAGDVTSMVSLLQRTALRMTHYEQLTARLSSRLENLLTEARNQLPQSADDVIPSIA